MTPVESAQTERRARERRFLDRLAGAEEAIPADRSALVVAHPDDETLGLGAQLPRLRGLTIVYVTDGAPRDAKDATAHGFAGREDYAAARLREVEAALAYAGIGPEALVNLDVPDQEASLRLPQITRSLADLFSERRIEIAFTHAYEGGHPDHDATAFAVHAACQLLSMTGSGVGLVEMPFYRAEGTGWVRQSFIANRAHPELAIRLNEAQRGLKRRMIDAHETQCGTLAPFSLEWERFRAAPIYDFTVLPNGGDLLYERYPWGMTGARWRDLARQAIAVLRLGYEPCA
jgi:N-acetylglucosamine malate deacetylase 2